MFHAVLLICLLAAAPATRPATRPAPPPTIADPRLELLRTIAQRDYVVARQKMLQLEITRAKADEAFRKTDAYRSAQTDLIRNAVTTVERASGTAEDRAATKAAAFVDVQSKLTALSDAAIAQDPAVADAARAADDARATAARTDAAAKAAAPPANDEPPIHVGMTKADARKALDADNALIERHLDAHVSAGRITTTESWTVRGTTRVEFDDNGTISHISDP